MEQAQARDITHENPGGTPLTAKLKDNGQRVQKEAQLRVLVRLRSETLGWRLLEAVTTTPITHLLIISVELLALAFEV